MKQVGSVIENPAVRCGKRIRLECVVKGNCDEYIASLQDAITNIQAMAECNSKHKAARSNSKMSLPTRNL